MQAARALPAYQVCMSETDSPPLLAFMQALLVGWVLGFALVGAAAQPPMQIEAEASAPF